MIFEFFPVLGFWSGLGWGLAGCVIAFLALLMILSIVFLQDSKEGGLGGAFGSAGGGDTVLGASGQKGIVKVTAVMSIIFFVLVIGWGMIDSGGTASSNNETKKIIEGGTTAPAPTGNPAAPAGGGVGPGAVGPQVPPAEGTGSGAENTGDGSK